MKKFWVVFQFDLNKRPTWVDFMEKRGRGKLLNVVQSNRRKKIKIIDKNSLLALQYPNNKKTFIKIE